MPTASNDEPTLDFNEFKDLVQKIVAVPKSEVDKKMAEWKRARKKKKTKAKSSRANHTNNNSRAKSADGH